jgi:rare lipoprotein A
MPMSKAISAHLDGVLPTLTVSLRGAPMAWPSIAGLVLALVSCGGEPAPQPVVPAYRWQPQPGAAAAWPPPSETGKASYYADSLAGNSTASGEPYDPRALTAAHRKLPFGTLIDVTTPDHRRRVRVRVNDRGPWVEGRVVDLSRAAAEQLDMIAAGVIEVNLYVLPKPAAAPAR